MKKLYRSKDNKIFTGIIGGLGEYLNIDPVVLRIIFVLLICFSGFFPGIIAYFLMMIIVPEKP